MRKRTQSIFKFAEENPANQLISRCSFMAAKREKRKRANFFLFMEDKCFRRRISPALSQATSVKQTIYLFNSQDFFGEQKCLTR
jgi:hypothetical protein